MSATDPYGPDSVAVYRLFNVPGALLYVGISDYPKRRFSEHANDKEWWDHVARWTVTWYPDRFTAEAEETRAIREEYPAFNIAKVPASDAYPDLRVQWAATFRQVQPTVEHLNELFLALVGTVSLPPQSEPARRGWTVDDIRWVYDYAQSQARPASLEKHQVFVAEWDARQVVAWAVYKGRPASAHVRLWQEVPDPPAEESGGSEPCTSTGRPIGACDCHSRHVKDEHDVQRFGRPIGTPIGWRKRQRGVR